MEGPGNGAEGAEAGRDRQSEHARQFLADLERFEARSGSPRRHQLSPLPLRRVIRRKLSEDGAALGPAPLGFPASPADAEEAYLEERVRQALLGAIEVASPGILQGSGLSPTLLEIAEWSAVAESAAGQLAMPAAATASPRAAAPADAAVSPHSREGDVPRESGRPAVPSPPPEQGAAASPRPNSPNWLRPEANAAALDPHRTCGSHGAAVGLRALSCLRRDHALGQQRSRGEAVGPHQALLPVAQLAAPVRVASVRMCVSRGARDGAGGSRGAAESVAVWELRREVDCVVLVRESSGARPLRCDRPQP